MLNYLNSIDYLFYAFIAYCILMVLWKYDVGGLQKLFPVKNYTLFGMIILMILPALVFPITIVVILILLSLNENRKKIKKT